ncbi:MAG: Wzz/FepE/Etk N-terminal domain-containing protein, partial [Polaromonas sp.]
MYIQQLNLPAPPSVLRQDPETNLLDLVGVVADNRWLIAGVTALAVLLGGAYAVLTTPVYEANSLIQVEETKENTGTTATALGAAANLFEIRSPASAEMEILRSRLVVGQAVQSLQLDLAVWPKYIPVVGKWLARGATSPSEPGFLGMKGYVTGNESLKVESFVIPPKFETKRFLVRLDGDGYALVSPDGDTLANGRFGTPLAFTVGGQKGQMLVSSAVGKPGAEFNLMRFPQLAVIERLQQSLLIAEQGRQSGVILTSLTGNNPEIIAQTLNEIGSMYVRQNVARKVAEAEKMLAFLKTNLPQLRAKIEQSESRFNQFRNRNGSFDLTTESKVVLDQSIKLQTSLLDLQQKRSDLDARFGPQHPNIQTIDVQIKGLTNELNMINNRMKSFPAVEQDYLRMTRDMKVDTELYASLLNSSQQLQLVTEGKVGNV